MIKYQFRTITPMLYKITTCALQVSFFKENLNDRNKKYNPSDLNFIHLVHGFSRLLHFPIVYSIFLPSQPAVTSQDLSWSKFAMLMLVHASVLVTAWGARDSWGDDMCHRYLCMSSRCLTLLRASLTASRFFLLTSFKNPSSSSS